MAFDENQWNLLTAETRAANAMLVAVSKTRQAEEIKLAYDKGQRDFGENYVQELVDKQAILPTDIHWHFIGHLQSNKVKYIAPFISLIHGIDSLSLLKEINKQGKKNNRVIPCLLQVYIAEEETKFGLSVAEVHQLMASAELDEMKNISIQGLMGMATNTYDERQIRKEFKNLQQLYKDLQKTHPDFTVLSMGMTSDYRIALEEGSNLIRIGSALFGERNYRTSTGI